MRVVHLSWLASAASAARVSTENVADLNLDMTATEKTAARRRRFPAPSPPHPVHAPAPPHPGCYDSDGDYEDSGGYHCSYYIAADCTGEWDTATFQSGSMCCVCGGGSPFPHTTTITTTTTTTTTTTESPVTVRVARGGHLTVEVEGIGKLKVDLDQLTVDNSLLQAEDATEEMAASRRRAYYPSPPPLPPPSPPPSPPHPVHAPAPPHHGCDDTDGDFEDSGGYHCSYYIPADCTGEWDTATFQSSIMCCVCGGGSSLPATTTETTTTATPSIRVQRRSQLTLEVEGAGRLTVELERDGQLTLE